MLRSITYALYLFVLFFAPLAFSAVDLWAQAITQGAAFTALLLLFLDQQLSKVPFVTVPGLPFALLFVVFGLFQLVPLPTGLIGLISPGTLELYLDALGAEHLPGFIPLSIAPEQTVREVFFFATCIAVYFLTIQLLSERKRLQQTIHLVLILSLVVGLVALLYTFSGNDKVLWLRKATKPGLIFGPFTYKNQFAGFMELLLPVAVAFFLYYRPRIQYKQSLRLRLAEIFSQDGTNTHIFYGFICVVSISSILLSRSRGGVLCAGAGLLFFFLWARKRFNLTVTMAYIVIFILAVGVGAGQVGWDRVDERFGDVVETDGSTLNGRLVFWKDSIPIVKDFPVLGTGLGTFSSIYPSYRSEPQNFFLANAHNDYLELLTDGGIVAATLVFFFLFATFKTTLKASRKRRDRFQLHLYIGSMAGVASLLLHCFTDYHFNNSWAVGIYFFFLLGITVTASHTRRHGQKTTLLPVTNPSTLRKTMALATVFFVFISGLAFYGGELQAQSLTPRLITVSHKMDKTALGVIVKNGFASTRFAPFNSRYSSIVAVAVGSMGQNELAESAFLRAINLKPTQAFYLQQYAFFLTRQGRLKEAERLLRSALKRNKFKISVYQPAAYWFLGQKRWLEAGDLFRKLFAIEPSLNSLKKELQVISSIGMPVELIEKILPWKTRPFIAYGRFLQENDQPAAAEKAYLRALLFAETEEDPQAWSFLALSSFFRKIGQPDKAFAALRLGVKRKPGDYRLRLALGDLFKREGINHKAAAEYRQALLLQPEDKKARQRLSALETE